MSTQVARLVAVHFQSANSCWASVGTGQTMGINGSPQGRGFTLIELMAAVAIIAALAAIAMPAYQSYVERSRRSAAMADLSAIMAAIDRFYIRRNAYPASLDELDLSSMRDPWGNGYQYLRISGDPRPNRGALRKDKNLVPINSDYDLYSKGKDGKSQKPLTAAASRDDIVRAGNGAFVGLASDY